MTVGRAPRVGLRFAIARTTLVIFLVVLLVAAALGVSYIETTNHTTSSTSSGPIVTLTESPVGQGCPSSSQSGSNLNWTEPYVGVNESDMSVLVLAVNSSSTASLCVSYSQNPEAAGFGMSEVNITAFVELPPQQADQCASNSPFASLPQICYTDVPITAQPDHLDFGNGSNNQQFFVKLTITVPSNSSGYFILGVNGLCEPAGIILNQNPSEITTSALSRAYSYMYMPSCGALYGAIGKLVGLSGLGYVYAIEPMSRPPSSAQ